jgi:hypothetical protein
MTIFCITGITWGIKFVKFKINEFNTDKINKQR